MKKSPRLSQKE
jgi:hypothetical protein